MKQLILSLTIIGLLFGCAENKTTVAQEPPRAFHNNAMGFDWATIRIADSFEYIGNIQYESIGEYRASTKDFIGINEDHYFIDKNAVKPNLNRLIIVRLRRPKNPSEYMSSTISLKAPPEGAVSQGTTKYGDMEIPYMVQGETTLSDTNKNFLLSKGYTMSFPSPSYYVRQVKVAARSVHAQVMYFEPGVDSNKVLANALKSISYTKE